MASSSYGSAFDIAPNDNANLPPGQAPTAIYVGGAGQMTVVLSDGSQHTFVGLLAGTIYPISSIRKVMNNGTSATGLIGLA